MFGFFSHSALNAARRRAVTSFPPTANWSGDATNRGAAAAGAGDAAAGRGDRLGLDQLLALLRGEFDGRYHVKPIELMQAYSVLANN